jgi:hypothetical protein
MPDVRWFWEDVLVSWWRGKKRRGKVFGWVALFFLFVIVVGAAAVSSLSV